MTKCDFSLKHYESILKTAKKKDFKFLPFTKKDNAKKIIYLRHDVDVSLIQALKIAEVDKKNKVFSTFFVRSHASFYNPITRESVEIIKKISSLGHMIGLHYDGEIDTKNTEVLIARDYNSLKNFIPLKRVISFHRPRPKVFGLELKGFISTYSNYFFRNCEYISDSNRELKKGCIKEFIERTLASRVQILTHPIWWNKKGLDLRTIYLKILKAREKEFTEDLKLNIKSYKELL